MKINLVANGEISAFQLISSTDLQPMSLKWRYFLNWFSKLLANLKFKYDVNDLQWIDEDNIISKVTLTFYASTPFTFLIETTMNHFATICSLEVHE